MDHRPSCPLTRSSLLPALENLAKVLPLQPRNGGCLIETVLQNYMRWQGTVHQFSAFFRETRWRSDGDWLTKGEPPQSRDIMICLTHWGAIRGVRVRDSWLPFGERVCRRVGPMEAVTVEEAALRITDRSLLPVLLALFILRLRVTALLPRNVAVILLQMIRPSRFFTP